jgi:hypothetical protein
MAVTPASLLRNRKKICARMRSSPGAADKPTDEFCLRP